MADTPAQSSASASPADKAFADWLGKVAQAGRKDGNTSLENRFCDLNQRQSQLLERIRQAESELAQARSVAVRQEGAGQQLAELLREEYDARQGDDAGDDVGQKTTGVSEH